jgi:hydrogenase maturation factor
MAFAQIVLATDYGIYYEHQDPIIQALVDKYMDEGIEAAVIGRVAEHKNKLVVNEDETRYLDSPSSDEVYKFV